MKATAFVMVLAIAWLATAAIAQDDGDWTIAGNHMYSAVPGSVGIGTPTPAALLDVRGTLNVGTDGTGFDVNFYGANTGSRFFWDEVKMALRAGWDKYGNYWAPASIGTCSVAMGYNTKASADYSTALGQYTTASGKASIAMGAFTRASGFSSIAMGRFLRAGHAANTIVLGTGVSRTDSLVNNIGNSLMVGFNTTEPTLFVGGPDHRVGIGTTSPAAKLDVQGTLNVGLEDSVGYDVNFYSGTGNGGRFFWDEDKMALRAGRFSAYYLDSLGTYSLATGVDTKAIGWASTAMGSWCWAQGDNSLAMGDGCGSNGEASIAMGSMTNSDGWSSVAMGGWCWAQGDNSLAIGSNCWTGGFASTAMGLMCGASGDYGATAIGLSAYARGDSSIAIGIDVSTDTSNAIVLGRGVYYNDLLVNNIENSLMVGFNSNIPTLFVGPSSGKGTTGNVGIGTTNPLAKVHVNGNLHLAGTDKDISWKTGQNLQFGEWDGVTWHERMRISAGGNVGIGTTSPRSRLSVVDSASGSAVGLGNNVVYINNYGVGKGGPDVMALRVSGVSNPGDSVNFITFFGGRTPLGAIEGDGAGGVTYKSASSDFAEWLPHLNRQDIFGPGDIVGVYGGKIARSTKDADGVLVISTAPLVLGNTPDDMAKDSYSKVSFLGQVPVRVIGPVGAGDYIVPSGRDDGSGIAVSSEDLSSSHYPRIVGQAWESSSVPGEKLVRVAVGLEWNAVAAWYLARTVEEQQDQIRALKDEMETLKKGLEQILSRLADENGEKSASSTRRVNPNTSYF